VKKSRHFSGSSPWPGPMARGRVAPALAFALLLLAVDAADTSSPPSWLASLFGRAALEPTRNPADPLLGKCSANPLLGSTVTDEMWARSEASSAAYMAQHTLQLSRTLQDNLAASIDLGPHKPRRGKKPGSPGRGSLQNQSAESLQPVFQKRFDLFDFAGECPTTLLAHAQAKSTDGSKFICGLNVLSSMGTKCVIYSVGSNNDFTFESSIANATRCEIHTFDCNVDPRVPSELKHRVKFHQWCFGDRNVETAGLDGRPPVKFRTFSETLRTLGHTHVDVLKIDIEGYEWDVFDAMLRDSSKLPFQILVELHLTAFWNSANLWWAGRSMTAGEVALWARRFYDLGYRVAKRHDSPRWPQSSDMTLVRFRC